MENMFLHKKVSIYKIYLTILMNRTHLFLNINTSTWREVELHLTKLESCTVCYLYNSMVSQAELISYCYHALVPCLISIFIDGTSPFKIKRSCFHLMHFTYLKTARRLIRNQFGPTLLSVCVPCTGNNKTFD